MRSAWMVLSVSALALGLSACGKGPQTAQEKPPAAPAATSAAAGGAIQPGDLPHPAAGLWKITLHIMGHDQVMQMCMDQAYVAKTSAWSQGVSTSKCSTQDFQRGLDGTVSFHSECQTAANAHVSTKGTVTGDLASHYKVTMDITTTGGGPADGTHTLTTESERVGDCPAGMKGGDMVLPGGMKMSAERMSKYQKQAEQLKGLSGQLKFNP